MFLKEIIYSKDAQASSEFILLMGGIMISVLLAIYVYRDYIIGLSSSIESNDLIRINSSVENISNKLDLI